MVPVWCGDFVYSVFSPDGVPVSNTYNYNPLAFETKGLIVYTYFQISSIDMEITLVAQHDCSRLTFYACLPLLKNKECKGNSLDAFLRERSFDLQGNNEY